MEKIGLYVHFPFCAKKCKYCDFVSYEVEDYEIKRQYVMALLKELDEYSEICKNNQVKSIFFGGGTPSILPEEYIEMVADAIYQKFNVDMDAEFTIETNPGTLNKGKLVAYKKCGINRLSMGVQAMQDNLLEKLGRIHSKKEFLDNYHLARSLGFENISVDLMFGLPDQTMEDWLETLQEILALKPEHVSAYSLKIEEGTVFFELLRNGEILLPDEIVDRAMYHEAIKLFKDYGYDQYEISNFALAGKQSQHNKIYWDQAEYIGVGAGAHSYYNKKRFSNVSGLNDYISNAGKVSRIEQSHTNNVDEEIFEYIFLALRKMEGLDLQKFSERFKIDFMKKYETIISKLEQDGLVSILNQKIRLTILGIDLSNQVFLEFME